MSATKNKFTCNDIEVKNGATFSYTTATTSITIITNVSSLSTASTKVTFTKQTMYVDSGVITDYSTVTTTHVLST